MRRRAWFLLLSFAAAVVLSGISCYDDDYWDDDDYYCHYDQNGVWHCHEDDDDDDHHHGRAQTDGVVIVLITDQPASDVSSFYVTITEVTLFEADTGPVSVYQSDTGRRLDLLSLRGSRATRLHDLLAVREIPSGVYGSIRLTLRDPVMVLSSGDVLEGAGIDLAGKGQIDIALAEQVLVGPDETVRVILDIDVRASIGSSAPSGPAKVRPVVLVDALYDDVEAGAWPRTDVEGELLEQDSESGVFHLELPEDRGGLEVRLLDDSEILDRALEPAPPGRLIVGSQVVARGVLRSTGELEIEKVVLDQGPGQSLPPGERERPAALLQAPIEGIVSRVAPEDGTLEVDVDGARRSIAVSPETTILVVEVAEAGLLQNSIPIQQVEVGADVVVHGEDGSPARLVVVTIGE